MVDNSDALRRSRRRDSTLKRQRATEALDAMEQTGEPITFPAVARHANVSVSLLYGDADLAARIAEARDRQRQAGNDRAWKLPTRCLVTEQSLRTDLANANQRTHRLAEEVALLRQRLARHLGADADTARGHTTSTQLDQQEHRAAELEADNHLHRQRITKLETDNKELADTLDAARTTNRQLMTQLNQTNTARPADGDDPAPTSVTYVHHTPTAREPAPTPRTTREPQPSWTGSCTTPSCSTSKAHPGGCANTKP